MTAYDPALAEQLAAELLEDADVTIDEASFVWTSGKARDAGDQLRAACEEVRRLRGIESRVNDALITFEEHVDELVAERNDLRAEVEGLRTCMLVPLTEQQVIAALHEGRAEAMAATGDNAWTSLLKQRDEACAEVELLRRDGDATREALIIQRDAVNDDNMRLRARLARIEPVYEAAVRWRRVIATASAMDVPGAQSPVNVPHYALIDAIDAACKPEDK